MAVMRRESSGHVCEYISLCIRRTGDVICPDDAHVSQVD